MVCSCVLYDVAAGGLARGGVSVQDSSLGCLFVCRLKIWRVGVYVWGVGGGVKTLIRLIATVCWGWVGGREDYEWGDGGRARAIYLLVLMFVRDAHLSGVVNSQNGGGGSTFNGAGVVVSDKSSHLAGSFEFGGEGAWEVAHTGGGGGGC
ncbi:unnamed protein product [Dicrocoelium dendriticum]|nr:unnamed protein product [Dicrocoelium dendriticum]